MSTSSSTPMEETIADCLSQAQHPDLPESQITALRTLSSLTRVSSHNRALLSRLPDSVPTFTALSVSPSPPIHTLALSVLLNLSLDPNLKHSLASQPNLLRHLNSILLSPASPNANKLAASLACSLATLDKNKAAFGIAGSVEAIVAAIEKISSSSSSSSAILLTMDETRASLAASGTASSPAILHLLGSLGELVQFHGNGTLAVRVGAVPALVRVLRGPAGEELGGACFATLALLARFEEGIAAIRAVDGVVELLVGGLRRGCMVSKDGASEILIRVLEAGDGECVREVAGKPELSSLLADLAIRGSAKAREKAGVLMKAIMEADLEGNHPWFLV